MVNSNLKSYLRATDPSRTALITRDVSATYHNIGAANWSGERSASVAIFCRDIEKNIRIMVALDGAVEAFCAMPGSLQPDAISGLLSQWPFDTVITDADASTRAVFKDHGLAVMDIDEALTGSAANGQPRTTKWLVPTSGTTSVPKLVVHTFESLARVALAGRKVTDPPQVWGMLYDVTRFAGYQVFFQAVLSGHTLVFAGLTTSMDERLQLFAEHRVSHLSATPTLWRKILMSPANTRLQPRQITLGGEAADQHTLTSLSTTYPQARITHIYASTEAGVGLAVSDGKAGFPLSYLESSFGGVDVRLTGDRLYLRAATGPRDYAGDRPLANAEGWVDTGDLVKMDADRFYIIGRESGVINVGGDKVVPEQVRDAMLDCDIVQDVLVYGKSNPFTGALVAADVVLNAPLDHSEARRVIDSFLVQRLTPQQRPRVLRFVNDIMISSSGKAALRPGS